MADVKAVNTGAQKIRVSNSAAKFYSDLSKQYLDEAKENAQSANESKVEIQLELEKIREDIKEFKRVAAFFDITEYPRMINSKTKQFIFTDEYMNKREFQGTNLKKVFISSSCTTIKSDCPQDSPFYELEPTTLIFTDIESADAIPEGWSQYWNNYSAEGKLSVVYNATLDDYIEYEIS